MTHWTRRSVMAAGGALIGGAALAQDDPLAGLLSDGPGGLLSAGLIARRGDGRIAKAVSGGRKLVSTTGGLKASPFALEDPFRVASVSMLITALGFMRLVEAGLVGLDDDVATRLGFKLRHPAFPDKPILVRHLLSHTSGLRSGPSSPVPAGHALREAFDPAGRYWDGGAWFGPKDKAPGDWFAYADVNAALLAQIIERVTAEQFDRLLTRTLTAPLDLDAGYNWSSVSQEARDHAAPGRRWVDGAWAAQVDDPVPKAPGIVFPQPKEGPSVTEAELKVADNGFLLSPEGGFRASLRDLDRLVQMLQKGGVIFGARVISADMLEKMQTPAWRFDAAHPNGQTGVGAATAGPYAGYGLGVQVPLGTTGPGGDAFFGPGSEDWRGHLGDGDGWMTGLFWNRRDGRTLVWALNGMREKDRPAGRRSILTASEEAIIDVGLAAIAAAV
jgi:CubicO group peptidase (beta-lactamase class C family)